MRPLRLIHLANFKSENIGNGALILGTERVLREDLGRDVTFFPEPWGDYTALSLKKFDENFVRLVNNQADGLLIGAAVTLDGSPKYSNTGMRFDLPLEMWSRISKPIVFYGISYRHWPYLKYHHLDKLKQTMELIENSPKILFSVRNDGTKAWLESLIGRRLSRTFVIPDPALYVPTSEAWHPEIQEGRLNIVVSLNNEDRFYRFGVVTRLPVWKYLSLAGQKYLHRLWNYVPDWKIKRKQVLKNLAAAIHDVSKHYDINVILCPHSSGDYGIMEEFVSVSPPQLAVYNIVSSSHLPESRATYFYDLYRKADAALSMRIHSMCPAIGVGTPVVTLDSQTRMTGFMKTIGLEDFALNIFDSGLRKKISRLLHYILEHGTEVKLRLQDIVSRMREETRLFNRRVASLFEQ